MGQFNIIFQFLHFLQQLQSDFKERLFYLSDIVILY